MSSTPVQIYRRADKTLVEAVLHTELAASALKEAEKQWGEIRRKTARKLKRAGREDEIPEHCHWDWGEKSKNLAFLTYRCCGIEYDGKYQGLLMLLLTGKHARLPPDVGKDLVYIDYIESAPWNYAKLVKTPLYGGIGPVLVRAAVAVSYEEELKGRIGLHALPQSEKFYRDDCQMVCCGPDASYYNLPYYEMTSEIATRFTANSSGGGA
jgi:hypothetical protein